MVNGVLGLVDTHGLQKCVLGFFEILSGDQNDADELETIGHLYVIVTGALAIRCQRLAVQLEGLVVILGLIVYTGKVEGGIGYVAATLIALLGVKSTDSQRFAA